MTEIEKQEHWLSLIRSHHNSLRNKKLSKKHLEAINKLGEMLDQLNPTSSYNEIYQIIRWIDLEFPVERLGTEKRKILTYLVQSLVGMLNNLK